MNVLLNPKAHCRALLLILSAGMLFSCTKDFLETEQKDSYMLLDTILMSDHVTSYAFEFSIPEAGNGAYSILIFPKWMHFGFMEGRFDHGLLTLNFNLSQEEELYQPGIYSGELVLNIEGFGILGIPVVFRKAGETYLQFSAWTLDFGEEDVKTLTLRNIGQGALTWSLNDLPGWLTASPVSGELSSGEEVVLAFLCDRTGLSEQDYTDHITIENNASGVSKTVEVRMQVNSIVMPLSGQVRDVVFCEYTDMLYLAVSNPDRLVMYSAPEDSFLMLDLPASPVCLDVSEDGTAMAIGYETPEISLIDPRSGKEVQRYEIPEAPFDVVLNGNAWCYISPDNSSWSHLVSLDLSTGVMYPGPDRYGREILRRIQGKQFLLTTSTNSDPDGLDIVDIRKGRINDTIDHYHMDTGNLWASHDGLHIYCGNWKIFTMPEFNPWEFHLSPNLAGQIMPVREHIVWMDDCTATGSFFAGECHWSAYPSVVEQFDRTNFTLQHTYTVRPYYISRNGIKTKYNTDLHYVFAHPAGSLLFVVKNIQANADIANMWSIERIRTK